MKPPTIPSLTITAVVVMGVTFACSPPRDRGTRSPHPLVVANETEPPLPSDPDLRLTLEMDTGDAELETPSAVSTIEPEPPPEPPPRQRPSEGMLILGLQEELDAAGHDPGRLDGVIGPQTEAAVREFQRESGLLATGLPDRGTLEALFAPEPIEQVAGYDEASERVEPAVIETGWPAWTIVVLVIALLVALAFNAAQWSSSRRVARRA